MKKISVQIKILTAIFVTLLLTITVVIFLTYRDQREDLLREMDKSIGLNSDTLLTSLRNMMLDGEAPVMVKTMEDLRTLSEFRQIAIYRSDGSLAFSDSRTLEEVNRFLGRPAFQLTPRIQDMRSEQDRAHDMKNIILAAETRRKLEFFMPDSREKEYYFPILTEGSCRSCHAGDTGLIRGVAHIRLSVKGIYRTIDQNRQFLILFFSAVGLFILTVIFLLLRVLIIRPVMRMEETVTAVGAGDFTARVGIQRNDEIGELAERIDTMTRGLEERFKLSKYVSRSTDQLVRGEIAVDEAGNRKHITVLFSDVRGFTSYSEQHSPEQVIHNLNRLLEVQARIVQEQGGDIDKFVGDELMAVFEDPAAAARSALLMTHAVEELDQELGQGLRIGVGLNTGDVVAGNIGSSDRREYAVIGDTVNVGARLCAAAPASTVYISASTYQALQGQAEAELLPGLTVKGKQQALEVYRLTAVR